MPRPILAPVILIVLAATGCDSGKEPTRKFLGAIDTGDLAEVQRLLPKINQIHAPDAFDGAVYLRRVAGSGDPKMLRRLVARGGDRGARLRIAELLMAKGADPKMKDRQGRTPQACAPAKDPGAASLKAP